jgi:hypothetical protein
VRWLFQHRSPRSRVRWAAVDTLADLDVVHLFLDAIALRVQGARKEVSPPVLGAVAVLADGQKQLVTLDSCGGGSFEAREGLPGCPRGTRPQGAPRGHRRR